MPRSASHIILCVRVNAATLFPSESRRELLFTELLRFCGGFFLFL